MSEIQNKKTNVVDTNNQVSTVGTKQEVVPSEVSHKQVPHRIVRKHSVPGGNTSSASSTIASNPASAHVQEDVSLPITAPNLPSQQVSSNPDTTSVPDTTPAPAPDPNVPNLNPDYIRQEALKRVKQGWLAEMSNGVFNTGLKGIVVEGTDDEVEIDILMPFDRNSVQTLRSQAAIMVESWTNNEESQEGMELLENNNSIDGLVVKLSENEQLALFCGFLPLSLIKKFKDTPIVLRDANNHYVQISFCNLLRCAYLMEKHASEVTSRKWMLEALIYDTEDIESLKKINWNTDYNDLDTGGM